MQLGKLRATQGTPASGAPGALANPPDPEGAPASLPHGKRNMFTRSGHWGRGGSGMAGETCGQLTYDRGSDGNGAIAGEGLSAFGGVLEPAGMNPDTAASRVWRLSGLAT